MSRMIAVRSITAIPSSASRLRSWRGESSSSQATRLASERDSGLQLIELAGAEVGVGMRVLASLDHLADVGHPRGPQQLLELGQLVVVGVVGIGDRGDHERALTRAPPVGGGGSRVVIATVTASLHCRHGSRGRRAATAQYYSRRIRSTASSRRSSGVVSEILKKPSPLAPNVFPGEITTAACSSTCSQ